MQEVTFELQTVTPLFLAGADQSTAELRPPTFRGLMRYWYRALAGGIVGTDGNGLKLVAEQEANIFGATDKGSSVIVTINPNDVKPIPFSKGLKQGVNYLFWSISLGNNKQRKQIPQGKTFWLTLSTRSEDEKSLKQAIAAFWLLTHLGGIGSRSRRCAGSIMASVVKNCETTSEKIASPIKGLPFQESVSIKALQVHLQQGIRTARDLCKLPTLSSHYARFDAIDKNTCKIWILYGEDGQAWNEANEALNVIGTNLQDYRSIINPLEKRKIFGLPLKNYSGRHASPLLLRITKLQGDKYVGIAVLFKTLWQEKERVPFSEYETIEGWIAQFPGKCEVKI